MKLNSFVSQVLQDIESGLNDAGEKNDKAYYVDTSNNHGVNFDIAVTTSNETNSELEGSAKAGIIEVLGAGVKGKIGDKKGNSEVSRIVFTVYVPNTTKSENSIEEVRIVQENQDKFSPMWV